MRDAFVILLFVVVLVSSVGAPFTGLLGWVWLTLMSPQKLAFGFSNDLPLNLILALVAGGSWIFSREPKRLPASAVTFVWLAFMAWITLSTLSAIHPELAWDRWGKVIKVMVLGLILATTLRERQRMHALAWVIALSLGYYGIKAGLATIVTAGQSHIVGAPETSLSDNNYLALALTMTIPFFYYLYLHSARRVTQLFLLAGLSLTAIGVIGTYSRGGLVGLAVAALFLWWRSRKRLMFVALAVAVVIPAAAMMPASWVARMDTISTASDDASFQNRLEAWTVAYRLANDHPLLGGGLGATENADVFMQYLDPDALKHYLDMYTPNQYFHIRRAVHSIYMQVLADEGYAGLALFVGLLVLLWLQISAIRRDSRGNPELTWVFDLASAMQVSLASYMVAGAALSMPYYDMPYILMGMSIALRKMVPKPARTAAVRARATPFARLAASHN